MITKATWILIIFFYDASIFARIYILMSSRVVSGLVMLASTGRIKLGGTLVATY